MTWPQALQEAIDQFSDVFDPMERYEMLFEWASDVNELPVDEWNDANMIHGSCHVSSRRWDVLHARWSRCADCSGIDGHHLFGGERKTT